MTDIRASRLRLVAAVLAAVGLVPGRVAHAMTGLQGVGAMAVLQAGMLAPLLLILAAWLAGRRHLPWACGAAALAWLFVFIASQGQDMGLMLVPLFGSLAGTCVCLVLAYRREGSFVRRFVGTALLQPWAFRDVADSRGYHEAALTLALTVLPVILVQAPLPRRLAVMAVTVAGWVLLIATAWVVARLVPPRVVDWRRLVRCVLFAAAPVAAFAVVLSLRAPDGVGARLYASYLWPTGYPSHAWLGLVLYVALRAALRRNRRETAAIAVVLMMGVWLSSGLKDRLYQFLV